MRGRGRNIQFERRKKTMEPVRGTEMMEATRRGASAGKSFLTMIGIVPLFWISLAMCCGGMDGCATRIA